MPGAAAVVVAMVAVDEPPEVTDDGLNETVTPAGAPVADRLIVCAEPLVTAVATVVVADDRG